jgi:hypothetical protein
MPVHGRTRSAAVRDPKVRLRGLGEIATNAPHAFLLQCTYLQLAQSGHGDRAQRCPLSGESVHQRPPIRCLLLTQSGHWRRQSRVTGVTEYPTTVVWVTPA